MLHQFILPFLFPVFINFLCIFFFGYRAAPFAKEYTLACCVPPNSVSDQY